MRDNELRDMSPLSQHFDSRGFDLDFKIGYQQHTAETMMFNWEVPMSVSSSVSTVAPSDSVESGQPLTFSLDALDAGPFVSMLTAFRQHTDTGAMSFDEEPSDHHTFDKEDSSSDESSDEVSDSDDECDVRVASVLGPILDATGTLVAVCELSRSEPARLSHLWSAKASGLPSIGSLNHCQGRCLPCAFQSRYLQPTREVDWRKGPCFKGLLCERCHEHHDSLKLKKKKNNTDTEKKVWAWKPRGGGRKKK